MKQDARDLLSSLLCVRHLNFVDEVYVNKKLYTFTRICQALFGLVKKQAKLQYFFKKPILYCIVYCVLHTRVELSTVHNTYTTHTAVYFSTLFFKYNTHVTQLCIHMYTQVHTCWVTQLTQDFKNRLFFMKICDFSSVCDSVLNFPNRYRYLNGWMCR